ncbi:hypothetical protein BMS3Abin15_00848 [bacterium BMS3Abin15]|nr:hypothetical protein BMS3Abin15_00848 [bacterium BMS3Abin15]
MYLYIHLKKEKITLQLKDNKKVIGSSLWNDENNLSEKLLPEIDKLIRKNKINKENIKLTVKTDIPAGYTTTRIAKSVANAWNYANK